MKNSIKLFNHLAIVALMMLAACSSKSNVKEGNPEVDSLQAVVDGKMAEMNEMDLFLDAVNASMDSVVNLQGIVLRSNGESPLPRKEQIRQNLEAYKLILKQQHERIAILEKKIKAGDPRSEKMLKTIAALKRELSEKDQAIVELTEELEKRKFDIQNLKKDIVKLTDNVSQLKKANVEQEAALVAQSDQMNEAYVLICTKEELKAMGLLSGGSLLKKSKLDMSKVNQSAFKKIDMRKSKSFKIPGRKPKILTQAPSGSYSISDNGDGTSTLNVLSAADFWSISNYLVVRY